MVSGAPARLPLVYLDAGDDYAYYDESHGSLTIDIDEIIGQLSQLRFGSGVSRSERRRTMAALADTTLSTFLKRLHDVLQEPAPATGPAPRPMGRIPYAVISGERKYKGIHGPVLAIFASPPAAPPGAEDDPAMRAVIAEVDVATALQVDAFARGVPQARAVRLPRASHFVFRSNEADALRRRYPGAHELVWDNAVASCKAAHIGCELPRRPGPLCQLQRIVRQRSLQAGANSRMNCARRSASVCERSNGMFATTTTWPARTGKAVW